MDYKKELVKNFWDSKWLTKSRYDASKNIFICFCLIFFLNYFFVWARFYDNIFLKTLPFTYVSFLVAIIFYIFYFLKTRFELKMVYNLAIILLLVIFWLLFLIPIFWISL